MKKNLMRVLAILMAGSMIFATACSSASKETEAETKAETKAETEAETKAETEAEKETEAETEGATEVTLTWLNHYQEAGKQAWVQSIKEQFEAKYENYTLNIETVGADTYTEILQTKIASDDAPAVFDLSNSADIKTYAEAGHLADLSNFECLANVDQDLLKEGIIDGTQYGIPVELTGYAVFYNVDVFEANGLEIPTTLSELTAVCDALVEAGVTPFATPFAEAWAFRYYPRSLYDEVCWNNDNDFFAKLMDRSLKFADSEDFRAQIETLLSYKQYWNNDPFGTSWDAAQQMVAEGEAAMCVHGSWAVDGIMSYNPDCTVGAFPMPVSEDPAESLMIKEPGQQLVLFNFEDEATKEAAEALYNMIYSQDCMKAYAEEAHQMPSVPGEYDMLPALKTIVNYPAESSFAEAGLTRIGQEYEDVMIELIMNACMEENPDIDQLLDDLDAAFDNLQ